MLGKLLKYDLKWTYKPLIVFYILALIFAVLGRGLTEIENSLILNIVRKNMFRYNNCDDNKYINK